MKTKLYVGNVSYEATANDLAALFAEAGTVLASRVIRDKTTGRGRGFAFIEMASETQAQVALKQFNGYSFLGRRLIIYFAHDNKELSRRNRLSKSQPPVNPYQPIHLNPANLPQRVRDQHWPERIRAVNKAR